MFPLSYPNGKPYQVCSDKSEGFSFYSVRLSTEEKKEKKKRTGKFHAVMFGKPTHTHANNGVDARLKDACSGNQIRRENLHQWAKSQTRCLENMEKPWWMRGELAIMRFYFQQIYPALIRLGLWNWLALTDKEGEWAARESRSMKAREPRARLWTTEKRLLFICARPRRRETSEWRCASWRMDYGCLVKHELSPATWHANKNTLPSWASSDG